MKPALIARLRHLREYGYIAAGRLSRTARHELRSLFDAGVLADRRVGAGRRTVVERPADFETWLRHQLPSGLDPELAGPPRASAVAAFRDAKIARRTDAEPVLMRVFSENILTVDGGHFPGRALTRQAGCIGVVLGDQRRVRIRGRIGVVENSEAFIYAEKLGPELDAALYASGRISSRVLGWMALQAPCSWIHLGDYDPVGLSEYLRLSRACGASASLWVPKDLENLVRNYGKAKLMEDSTDVWHTVRQSPDPAVESVVAILDRHAMGLEQEILLLRPATPELGR